MGFFKIDAGTSLKKETREIVIDGVQESVVSSWAAVKYFVAQWEIIMVNAFHVHGIN